MRTVPVAVSTAPARSAFSVSSTRLPGANFSLQMALPSTMSYSFTVVAPPGGVSLE